MFEVASVLELCPLHALQALLQTFFNGMVERVPPPSLPSFVCSRGEYSFNGVSLELSYLNITNSFNQLSLVDSVIFILILA